MRDDSYFYIEDGDLPNENEIVWCDTPNESGQGFLRADKWYTTRTRPFSGSPIEFKGKVVCWRRIQISKRDNKNENHKA